MRTKINWFGLAGGSLTIAIVVASFFIPWWSLYVEGFLQADVSPLHSNFSLLNSTFTVPLITALTIVGLLSFVASGVVMLIYSVLPTKPYSKHLLGFAYKKPLFALIFFVVTLFAISTVVQIIFGFSFPLTGSANLAIPASLTRGANVSFFVSTGFSWLFWLVAIAAGLCITAKIYHKRFTIVKQISEETQKMAEASQPGTPVSA